MSLLQNHEALQGILAMIVYAKEKGMMDHREARDLWQQSLKDAGVKTTVGPVNRG
jgi:hypothetical protein